MNNAEQHVPAGVQIERYFSVVEIDNGDSEVNFFPPNPSGVSTDNNYSQNPFPGQYYYVILGITLDSTVKVIRQDANIDPAYIINNLNDATLTLATNQGRTEDFVHPLKDYFNFTGIQTTEVIDSNDAALLTAALQSTGVRKPDNVYFQSPNEGFTLKAKFNSGTWPTTANWGTAGIGRFAIKAEMKVAKMNATQLRAFAQSLGVSIDI